MFLILAIPDTLPAAQAANSDIRQLIIAITLSYILNYALGKVYLRCSDSLSNKYAFSRLFPIISAATCLIIFVVKSSLALSLGLVGALSIVRFRTAIKDPEELIFLFISIALGLASGAGQYTAAFVGFLMISFGTYILKIRRYKSASNNLFRLNCDSLESVNILPLINCLKEHVERVDVGNLISSNSSADKCNINFTLSINNIESLVKLREELKINFSEASFMFIEVKVI